LERVKWERIDGRKGESLGKNLFSLGFIRREFFGKMMVDYHERIMISPYLML
jgi:hypothetical protein